jgi:transcription antitermination factor NusG
LASGERWFALQVKVRWEGSTAAFLSGKGYETFVPSFRTKRRWGGGIQEVSTTLFPGYVFCHFDAQKRLPILVTPGVVSVVGRGRVPVPLEDAEILAVRAAVSSGFRLEPWPYLEIGQRVRIEDEALRGLEGILIDFRGGHRIIVSVSLLRRSVAMEIDRSRVVPITRGRAHNLEVAHRHNLLHEVVA